MRKKTRRILCLLAVCLLLAGCGNEKAVPGDVPAGTAQPQGTEAQASLAQRAEALLAPYEQALFLLAQQDTKSLAYTIPGDMLRKLAQDAAAEQAAPQSGRYQFTHREESTNVYEATGLEVKEALEAEQADATPEPAQDAPMSDDAAGDFAVSGGGVYQRTYAYQAAEELTDGTVEITAALNGENAGYELFTFALRDGALYFSDAVQDMEAALDELENTGAFLVTLGKWESGRIEMVEYKVSGREEIPQAAQMDFSACAARGDLISHTTVEGENVRLQ